MAQNIRIRLKAYDHEIIDTSTKKIVDEYPPSQYGYTLHTMPVDQHSMAMVHFDCT